MKPLKKRSQEVESSDRVPAFTISKGKFPSELFQDRMGEADALNGRQFTGEAVGRTLALGKHQNKVSFRLHPVLRLCNILHF